MCVIVGIAMCYVFGLLVLLASTGTAVIQTSSDDRMRPVCRPSTRCAEEDCAIRNCYRYKVNGHELIVDFQDGEYFTLRCNSNSTEALLVSDDSEMPTMPQPVTVEKAVFNNCIIPQTTYFDTLKAFNVNVSKIFRLHLPAEPKMEVRHLRGLQITELEMIAVNRSNPPRPSSAFLDELPGLRSLKLTDIVLEPKALSRLPISLEILNMVNARLPAAEDELRRASNGTTRWIERLESLRSLYLVESSKFATKNPGAVLRLPQLASLRSLVNASFYYMPVDENGLSSWLRGSSVKELIMKSCGLTTIPVSMFREVNLTKIILKNNKLTKLEHGLFTWLQNSLTELDLSNNNLTSALNFAVEQLKQLETLKANNNNLGSLCGDPHPIKSQVSSFLPKSLRRLELRNTGATRICTDWIRDSFKLKHIDLSNNNIKELEYHDLEMQRMVRGTVSINLTENKLSKIDVSEENYHLCRKEDLSTTPEESAMTLQRVPVELTLTSLPCDCNAYWLREVLRDCSLLRMDGDVNCVPKLAHESHDTLLKYGPDEISCPYSGTCMPSECNCTNRPRDNATIVQCATAPSQPLQWPPAAPNYPLVLHVAPRTLDQVPNITLVELYAPNNNITTLDNIPKTLHVLDVRNNSISHISPATARAFRETNPQVNLSLSGNQLACECADAYAFSVLKHVVRDWNTTQCKDRRFVSEKTESELCSNLLLPILFGIAVPLLLVAAAILLIPRMLPRLKQFLFRHDLCHRWIDSANDDIDDPNKTHDVFLSYAHPDLKQLLELKSGLEKLGYSTIDHQIDWSPGEHVMDQIANSVLKARRTLLLVSDNYANSEWTKGEFLAAHTHAMQCQTARVLIVRCGLHNEKALPEDLQHYLYNHTYLDWDADKFWVKLCRVMPPLRQESLFGPLDLDPPSRLPRQEHEKKNPLLQVLLEPNMHVKC